MTAITYITYFKKGHFSNVCPPDQNNEVNKLRLQLTLDTLIHNQCNYVATIVGEENDLFLLLMLFTNLIPLSVVSLLLLHFPLILLLTVATILLLLASHNLLIVEGVGKLQGLNSYWINLL